MPEFFGVITPHPPIFIPAVGGARASTAQLSLDALDACGRALARFDPDLIVLMSPHAPAVGDAFAVDDSARYEGDLGQFGDHTPYGRPGDPTFATALLVLLEERGLLGIGRSENPRLRPGVLDHGAIVPLHFLDPQRRFPLVELSLSYLPYEAHRLLGECVRQTAEKLDARVAFVASGDLSHRLTRDAPAGYSARAADLDAAIVQRVREGSLGALMHLDEDLVEAGGECGLRSFIALGGFLGDDPQPTEVLSYEGPWGVGYLTALAGNVAVGSHAKDAAETPVRGSKGGSPGHDDSEVVRLAREAVEAWVRDRRRIEPGALTDERLPVRAGAFVTLHEDGELRGCIGTIAPTTETLAEEIVRNAIEASTRDPRFEPVTADELPRLDIKVDVLHEPERASFEELDPARYGVIVTAGARRGLLLPDLEGVDDAELQVAIAMRKAGIASGERVSLERFLVDRYT